MNSLVQCGSQICCSSLGRVLHNAERSNSSRIRRDHAATGERCCRHSSWRPRARNGRERMRESCGRKGGAECRPGDGRELMITML